MRKLALFILPVLALSCAVQNDENDGPVFCSIDQTESYELGVNPGADFNETNIVKTTTFNNTDCPRINNDPFDVLVSRAKRVGNEVQIFERQYTSGQFLLEMEVSGTTLLPVKNVVNISNCSIVRRWSGTLNTAGTDFTVNELVTYKGACESTFFNPEFDVPTGGNAE